MEPNPSLMPQPQNQPYFHVRTVGIKMLIITHHCRQHLMDRNGDLTHKGDFPNTEDHLVTIIGHHPEVQWNVAVVEVEYFTLSSS